jgi:hypothetical protein
VQVSFGCVTAAPAISLAPTALALRAGETASFSVNVTNQDMSGCDDRTIALDYAGGNVNSWLSPTELTLSALQAAAYWGRNPFDGWPLSTDCQCHGNGRADISWPGQHHPDHRQHPPSVPTGLSASVNRQGRVTLSWQAASYEYAVSARDQAGNTSAISNPLLVVISSGNGNGNSNGNGNGNGGSKK